MRLGAVSAALAALAPLGVIVVNGSETTSRTAVASEATEEGAVCLLQRNRTITHKAVRRSQEQKEALAMLSTGVTEGMGMDYAAQPPELVGDASVARAQPRIAASVATSGGAIALGPLLLPSRKNKLVLVALEACPLCWLVAADRFYLGAPAASAKLFFGILASVAGGYLWRLMGESFAGKFACIAMCFSWGLADFGAVTINSLMKQRSIDALGLQAAFNEDQVEGAFVLAVVELLMLPSLVILGRCACWCRKRQRDEELLAASGSKLGRNPQPGSYGSTDREIK